MLVDGEHDLKPTERFVQPDDGNEHDLTVAAYRLPAPLAPGDSIDLDIRFSGRIPRIFARAGIHGGFLVGGQWFPKIAVFEDKDEGRDQFRLDDTELPFQAPDGPR